MTTELIKKRTGLTAHDLENLHIEGRFELIEGELIALSAAKIRHGYVTITITAELISYNKRVRYGSIFAAETGFYTRGDDRTVRAPDVSIISFARLPLDQVAAFSTDFGKIAPDLVVEVVSPHDSAAEIAAKVQEWLNFGVRMVWVAYPVPERVAVHTSTENHTLEAAAYLDGGDVLPGFSVNVKTLFDIQVQGSSE
jgi:Uma2 family endonuclease